MHAVPVGCREACNVQGKGWRNGGAGQIVELILCRFSPLFPVFPFFFKEESSLRSEGHYLDSRIRIYFHLLLLGIYRSGSRDIGRCAPVLSVQF